MKAALLASLLLLAAALPLRAQYVAPIPPAPSPGLINGELRDSDPYLAAWDFGVNIRIRNEDNDGAGFDNAGSNWDFGERKGDRNNNEYWLTRVMPRVAYSGEWFGFMLELRSSYSFGDNRYTPAAAGQNLPERDGPLDVQQAYLFFGNHKEFPLSLKVGRQDLVYGEQRILGNFRWNNVGRTFDAVKVRWQNALFGVDLFTGGMVYASNDHLNRSDPHDRFSGAYFNFPTVAKADVVEAYFLARNVSRRAVLDNWSNIAAPARFPAPQDLYTAGVRIKSKPGALGPWDYGVELMDQFGDRTAVFPATTVAAALAAPRLRQDAQAAVLQAGYTWTDEAVQPRLAFIYSYGSGDHNAADGKSTTFQNLFPTNHLFYGYMDLSSLQNLHDLRLAYTLKPTATATAALEIHQQYLATTSDYWYNVAGVPRNFTGAAVNSGSGYRINPAYGNDLGQEADAVCGWAFTPWAQLEGAVCHYFRGAYIKESLRTVGSKDASYAYVQLTLNL